jgi:soluble lytic murein transglycosylase-like protein
MNFRTIGVVLTLLASIVIAGSTEATAREDLRRIVDRQATAHGVPVAFARAVVRVESNWNPQLTGAAGEVGLMQIKHDTARSIGYAGSRTDLYEPETNIRWGMRYLSEAWRLGRGDLCQAALRYQGGLNARRPSKASAAYCERLRRYLEAAG